MAGRVPESNACGTKKLICDGGTFYLEGAKVKVRMNDDGFSIGCTSVTWDVYDKLTRILEAGR
jgi:hypothetical protein